MVGQTTIAAMLLLIVSFQTLPCIMTREKNDIFQASIVETVYRTDTAYVNYYVYMCNDNIISCMYMYVCMHE